MGVFLVILRLWFDRKPARSLENTEATLTRITRQKTGGTRLGQAAEKDH